MKLYLHFVDFIRVQLKLQVILRKLIYTFKFIPDEIFKIYL